MPTRQPGEIDPRLEIELKAQPRDWVLLILMLIGVVLLILIPNPLDENNTPTVRNAGIAEAAEDLRDITETVATDTTLDEQDREQLLETLETSLDTLEEDGVTTEEAFAAMSDVASDLEEQAEEISELTAEQEAALRDAAEAFENSQEAQDSNDQQAGSNGEGTPTLEEALSQSSSNLDQLSPEEAAALADALEQAASELRETNPELADQLQDAADALRENGYPSSAAGTARCSRVPTTIPTKFTAAIRISE